MKIARVIIALSLLTSMAALAQSKPNLGPSPAPRPPGDNTVRTIRVEGTGEVKAEPDEGWVDMAVETSGATAKAAGEENAKKMERLIAALVAAGIPRREIDTRNYSVYPEYTQPDPRNEPKLKGYRVSNTVSVHVRELPRMGELIDRALAAGANRVDGVRFALSKEDAVRAEALRQAVERARKTAEVLAAALGVRLGVVLDASTVAEPPRLFPAQMMAMDMAERSAASPTPILPEAQTIQGRVTLTFAVESAR